MSIPNFFIHLSSHWVSLAKTCNSSPEGGNTVRGVGHCLLMRTLLECWTDFSEKENRFLHRL